MKSVKEMTMSNWSAKFPGVALTLPTISQYISDATAALPTGGPATIRLGQAKVPNITPELFCSRPNNVPWRRVRRRKKKREAKTREGVCGKHSVKLIIPGPKNATELAAAVFAVMSTVVGPNAKDAAQSEEP